MKRICIESPLSGDFAKNIEYARRCMRYVLDLGHAPFASHLLYTQVLDDRDTEQRARGLDAGLVLGDICDARWFFPRDGKLSRGMQAAWDRACVLKQPHSAHELPEGVEITPTPGMMRLSPDGEQCLRMVSSALGNARVNMDTIFRELDGDKPG